MTAEQHKHIIGQFQNALEEQRHDVLRMASITADNLRHAMQGLLLRDNALCNRTIANDEEVDQLELEIDRLGLEIIMRFSPVAGDLRMVMASMKIANNLERISDQAVNIAKRARKLNRHPELPECKLIEPIYEMALSQLEDGIAAFRDGDVEKSLGLDKRDDAIDSQHKKITKQITRRGEEDSQQIAGYINLIFIARFIERIGDRAVNIGEDCVYAHAATDIRHGGAPPSIEAN